MNLLNDIARCDGLLPKMTTLNGEPQIMWSIDCPRREQCARYCQMKRDNPEAELLTYSYLFTSHAPNVDCPHFIAETTDKS